MTAKAPPILYYGLYTTIATLLLTAAMPFVLIRAIVTGKLPPGTAQRLGFLPMPRPRKGLPVIWLHAASVGEVGAARSMIAALEAAGVRAAYTVTTMTVTGFETARRQLGPDTDILFAPLDLPWVAQRFIANIRPQLYLCLETELWPNTLRRLRRYRVPTLLVNGRLSERSFRRYHRLRGFFGPVVAAFDRIAAITPDDGQRLADLGGAPDKIMVAGNIKYDLGPRFPTAADIEQQRKQRRALLGIDHQPLLVAGSTRTGEEEQVLAAWSAAREAIPELVLLIAPRHLERLGAVKALCVDHGGAQPYSELAAGAPRRADIIIMDRYGELAGVYAAADHAFCGGSLADRGGHNIMEPAVYGVAPLYGPHMKDFADARALLEEADAGTTITSAAALAAAVIGRHRQPEKHTAAGQRAREVVRRQQGSARRQADLVAAVLETRPAATGST